MPPYSRSVFPCSTLRMLTVLTPYRAASTWMDSSLARIARGVQKFVIDDPDPYIVGGDRAATLVIEVPVLEPAGARLAGPGIRDAARLSLPETAAFRANRALFPLGFDAFLTCGDRIAGLPRSTIVGDV